MTCFLISCDAGPTPSDLLPEDGGTTTSSTSVGNPSLDINMAGSVYLTLNQDNNNLKQVNGDSLSDVLTYSDPDLAANTLIKKSETAENIPAAKRFFLGPQTEIVVEFYEEIIWEDSFCLILYSDGITEQCVRQANFDLQGDMQFDEAGQVYYFGYDESLGITTLVKWDPTTGESKNLINQNINLSHWLVHANGTVYMSGDVENTNFFRVIETDDTLVNLMSDQTIIKCFNFIDASQLIIQGENIEFQSQLRNGNFVYDIDQGQVIREIEFVSGDLTTLQIDADNTVYVLDEGAIYSIYPNTPQKMSFGLGEVSLFKIYGNDLYAAGQDDMTQQLVKISLGSSDLAVEVVLQDQEIYHLVKAGETLYFDSLNFNTNTLAVSQVNMITYDVVVIEDVLQGLVQLESADANYNYSLTERDFRNQDPYVLTTKIKQESTYKDMSELTGILENILFRKIEISHNVDINDDFLDSCYLKNRLAEYENILFYINCDSELKIGVASEDDFYINNYSLPLYFDEMEQVTLLSQVEPLFAILGTDVNGRKSIKMFEAQVNEAYYVSLVNKYNLVVSDTVEFIYANDQQEVIFVFDAAGNIVMLNPELKSFLAKKVYSGPGSVISVVADFNGLLFLRVEEVFAAGVETRVLIIDQQEMKHLQTIGFDQYVSNVSITSLTDKSFSVTASITNSDNMYYLTYEQNDS